MQQIKQLKESILYQIFTLKVALYKNKVRFDKSLKKYGYSEGLREIGEVSKDLYKQLEVIELELKKKYNSLELNSQNLDELLFITLTLLQFKEVDEVFLKKVESKIEELTIIKENLTKNHDFKKANTAREEIHRLQQYYNKYKHIFTN